MEESINPSPVPSNCTSPVCSDPAHDDLALDSEWSDEDRDCVGDGPHRVVEDPEDLDVPDVRVREDEDQEVQQVLLRFSGAHAPEILRYSIQHTEVAMHEPTSHDNQQQCLQSVFCSPRYCLPPPHKVSPDERVLHHVILFLLCLLSFLRVAT